jgi:hypothetical protein
MEVQQQVVSGMLYKFNGIFKNAEGEFYNCDIDLWVQEWLENESERVKITLTNRVKLDGFDEKAFLARNSGSLLTMSLFLLFTILFLSTTLQQTLE